ncbi:hypothetical protein SEVIR_7G020300v4 [Setaria viridis]|uniref:Uncharacterized protein n=2 Tax=Setaria TaxID=4554 RepID=K3YBG1_SETIT|nr:hypothetical protein SETIT_7G033600v2 [Setaria italica]TKW03381.1 hypothetical protein SEVIR_7G020300v2 [Setaria viridis]TKW03382.1 hypothetical protein SEVIR_7G020300v2 [Setaria viridis]
MQMKIIGLLVIGIVVINSCTCIPNKIDEDRVHKDVPGKEVRKLTNTDGRAASTGDAIDHVCPLGSYPCR